MPTISQSIDSRLLAAQIAIDNALSDNTVKSALAGFGYDDARLNEGKALFDAAQTHVAAQKKEYGEQFAATDALNDAWNAAQNEYMKHVKLARIAFKNNRNLTEQLALGGTRKRSVSGWLTQAKQFYANAAGNNEVITGLGRFGVTADNLNATGQLVLAVETALANQSKEKGEAQQATVDRGKALDALDEWMGDFIAVARIALEDNPQLLEKLGIVVASE